MTATTCTSVDDIAARAAEHGVPLLDALLIGANAEGATTDVDYPRTRLQLRPIGSDETWQVILPLDNPLSPFRLAEDALLLGGEPVASLVAMENDDVVLTYLRAGGRSITLNTHSRSTCTGCLFCPNVIEDAADATIDGTDELSRILSWVEADNDWDDLSHAEVITVCSGCFHTPEAAVAHMRDLRRAADDHKFQGRLHLLSSVVRERRHLRELAADAGPFHLTLTVECFTRRNLLLKESKASLTLDDACRILDDCADFGMLGDFTYVAGLDPLPVAVDGLLQLAEHASTFPRIQVFQAHNDYMRRARSADAADVGYHLQVRNAVEDAYARRGLAPRSWENYRPLWYSSFAGSPVPGPRV